MTLFEGTQIDEFGSGHITRKYINGCKNSMVIVGKILEEIIEAQNENAIQKFVKRVGKQYVAKEVLALAATTYRITTDYGDRHQEKNLYNYEEEVVEPKPVPESINIKIIPRGPPTEFERLDTDMES